MNDYPENATLDLTAYRAGLAAYRQLVSTYVAEALLRSESDEHRRLVRFARGLDEAGLSIRSEVDLCLTTFHEHDAASAWMSPIARKAADTPNPRGGPSQNSTRERTLSCLVSCRSPLPSATSPIPPAVRPPRSAA